MNHEIGCSPGKKSAQPATLTSGFSLLYSTVYSVQCTVQCTLYCSVQYRCVGYPGTQCDVTITKVIRIKSFLVTFMQNNFSLFCGKREKISKYSKI